VVEATVLGDVVGARRRLPPGADVEVAVDGGEVVLDGLGGGDSRLAIVEWRRTFRARGGCR
jgi:hypothetical protein